ncbi:MAG: hypothetical protein OEV77_01685 [Nitrospira sp.]|nr:hypothetical protein [Nitrospira sp.]MDH4327211.1 hypothetical protein [Nitrospira sp.]
MMMTRKQRTLALVGTAGLVAAMLFPGLADEGHGMTCCNMHGGHEQGEQGEHSGHYLKHVLKHAKEVGLTPEQIGKLKAMQLDFQRTEARLEADVKIAELELHALLEDEQAQFSVIQAKVEQLKKAEGALMLSAIKVEREGMALLTTDQREKDRAHRERMKSGGDGQHGGGMGGMGMGGMMGGGGHGGQGGGGHGNGGAAGGQQHQH